VDVAQDLQRTFVVPIVENRLQQVQIAAGGHLLDEVAADELDAVGLTARGEHFAGAVDHLGQVEQYAGGRGRGRRKPASSTPWLPPASTLRRNGAVGELCAERRSAKCSSSSSLKSPTVAPARSSRPSPSGSVEVRLASWETVRGPSWSWSPRATRVVVPRICETQ
jgi:hypothetical protein